VYYLFALTARKSVFVVMAAELGLTASGSGLDGILLHGVTTSDVLDEFIAGLDQQLSDNQTQ